MKQGDVKKIIIIFMLLLLLCACGENEKNTVGDTNSAINDAVLPTVTAKATEDNASADKAYESSAEENTGEPAAQSSVEEQNVFRSGTWAVSKSDGTFVFLGICDDGRMLRWNIEDGKKSEFAKGVFPEEMYLGFIEQVDEDRYVCTDNGDRELVFEYVSTETDSFKFYSDEKLKSRAVGLFARAQGEIQIRMLSEIKSSEWEKAVVTVRSGPVKESYEFDRFTGEGKRINEE